MTHFWLHNIAFPVMQASLITQLLVTDAVLPVTIVSSILVVLGVLLYSINLIMNANSSAAAASANNNVSA